jgi:hypothetical protein
MRSEALVVRHWGGRIGMTAYQMAYGTLEDDGSLSVRRQEDGSVWETVTPDRWAQAQGFSVSGTGLELYTLRSPLWLEDHARRLDALDGDKKAVHV